MIEEEAKKTICPKMSGYVSAGVEGSVDFYECLCFGSACQWWEWNEMTNIDPMKPAVKREYSTRSGHCGAVK